MKYKITFTDIIIAISVFSVCIYVTIVFNILGKSLLLNKLSQGFYSDDAVSFKTSGKSNIYKAAYERLDKYILYTPDMDLNSDIRAVALKGRIEPPPMASGRFFDEKDFGAPVCVMGQERKNDIRYIDSKPYYEFNNIKYEVIGIMGADFPSNIDQAVFLSMNGQTDPGVYIIDQTGLSQNKIEKALNVRIIERRFDNLDRFFRKETINIVFYILAFLLMIFCTVNIITYWLKKRQKAIGAMQMLGIANKHISRNILTRYSFFLLTGLLICCILCLTLNMTGIVKFRYLAPADYIIILLVTILTNIIAVHFSSKKLLQKHPIDNLRS